MEANKTRNTKAPLHGVGRRKRAVARVWIKKGSGSVTVNTRAYEKYFDTDINRSAVVAPLVATGLRNDFDIQVNVAGGGLRGQSEAVQLGIARSLLAYDEALRKTLREHKFLTVDSRIKERKKYGQRGARRKFQFVKR